MKIGIPKEIKTNENRVSITPAGVHLLVCNKHTVYVETCAGIGSGIPDEDYIAAGASILSTAKEVFDSSDMIMKVKEPQESEHKYFREGLIIYTYFHLAAFPELTKKLLETKVTAIAYETIEKANRYLPLLAPMSEVAGKMSVQAGIRFLEKVNGGSGVLLGGVAGVLPGKVMIIGGGIVGTSAAKIAVGLGADVVILDTSASRMRELENIFAGRVKTLMSNSYNITREIKLSDLVISGVLIPGAKAPKIITEKMVKTMKKGSVIVDVAIDQGGSVETITHATTHENPVYTKHGIIHYAVANIPGAVPITSTYALMNATVPYALQVANNGLKKSLQANQALCSGVNTIDGKLTYKPVADAHSLLFTPLEDVI